MRLFSKFAGRFFRGTLLNLPAKAPWEQLVSGGKAAPLGRGAVLAFGLWRGAWSRMPDGRLRAHLLPGDGVAGWQRLQLRLAGAVIAAAVLTAPALAQTYQYDAAGRLTGVIYSSGGGPIYTYDGAGNLLILLC
jgi:YD repeat-containing protein